MSGVDIFFSERTTRLLLVCNVCTLLCFCYALPRFTHHCDKEAQLNSARGDGSRYPRLALNSCLDWSNMSILTNISHSRFQYLCFHGCRQPCPSPREAHPMHYIYTFPPVYSNPFPTCHHPVDSNTPSERVQHILPFLCHASRKAAHSAAWRGENEFVNGTSFTAGRLSSISIHASNCSVMPMKQDKLHSPIGQSLVSNIPKLICFSSLEL